MAAGRLAGKVAFITGTGRGIGRAAAHVFAAEGASVYGCDINAESAAETVALVRAAGGEMSSSAAIDLGDPDDARRWIAEGVDRYGAIDILYNNAAAVRMAKVEDVTPADWSFTLRNELDLVMWTTQAAWPYFTEAGGGVIVNTGSIGGLRGNASLGQSAHTAAMAGVLALTVQHAAEGAHLGIRVNAVVPGPTDTPSFRAVLEKTFGDDPPELGSDDPKLRDHPALYRVGHPEDAPRCAVFLASDDAAWITGESIVVDGGKNALDGIPPAMSRRGTTATTSTGEAG